MSGIELFELGAFGTEEFTDTPNRLLRLGTNYVDLPGHIETRQRRRPPKVLTTADQMTRYGQHLATANLRSCRIL